jgi:hypothetical protein
MTYTTVKRPCSACGQSQARRKVWEKYGKQVICFACAGKGWTFDREGKPVNRSQ